MVLEDGARNYLTAPHLLFVCICRQCRPSSEYAASSCGSAAADSTTRASVRADQVLRRDRYVAKTTTATATQAMTYSVEVSPVVLLIAVSRTRTKLLTTMRITYPPLKVTSARVAHASTCGASTSSMSARSAFDHASVGVLRCQRLFLTRNIIIPENTSEMPSHDSRRGTRRAGGRKPQESSQAT
jgi:hypothetical protein